MSDLFGPLLDGCEPYLSTSHIDGRGVLWVTPSKRRKDGYIEFAGPCEGPFVDLVQAERAFAGRMKFTAQNRRDCRPVR